MLELGGSPCDPPHCWCSQKGKYSWRGVPRNPRPQTPPCWHSTWRDEENTLQDFVLGDLQDLFGDIHQSPHGWWYPPEIQDPEREGVQLRSEEVGVLEACLLKMNAVCVSEGQTSNRKAGHALEQTSSA